MTTTGRNESSQNIPLITARITFSPPGEGGRKQPPTISGRPWYRPHVVFHDPTVRSAAVDENGMSIERYLGVQFIEGPENPEFNRPDEYQLQLVYHPRVDYTEVVEGETFTVREGGRVVGYGLVLSRA